MAVYVKESNRVTVKIIQESTSEVILEVPSSALELHDWFKADYVTSVLRNTFGAEKLNKIGNVFMMIDQKYNLSK
jgi:hypothetical protein